MFSKFRSLIFKFDPEIAHSLAIKSLKFNFVPNIFDENKNNPIFQTTLFGKRINNPIGMAAGFDKNAEVYNSLFKLGFGFVEVGTVTPFKQFGNPKPRVFRLEEDQALINRLGFNSFGAENVNSRIRSNTPDGVFVDKLSGAPLFDTRDRFNSGTGWLSFTKPVDGSVYRKADNSYGMRRIEIRSKTSDIHLGHVFPDGPNGLPRYCINATVLEFKNRKDIDKS